MYSGNSGRVTTAAGYGATVSGMKERILVQDDEEPIREIMCSMLAAGYECLQAASPKKAWAILKSGKEVGVVLCGLLESSEEELVERMTKTFPDIPVVVVSACHEFSMFETALCMGAYDYLRKPFRSGELLAVVRRAMEYRRLKLENRALRAKLAKKKSARPGGQDDTFRTKTKAQRPKRCGDEHAGLHRNYPRARAGAAG